MFYTTETREEKDIRPVSPSLLSFDFSPPAWRENVPSVSFIHINFSVQALFHISARDDESEPPLFTDVLGELNRYDHKTLLCAAVAPSWAMFISKHEAKSDHLEMKDVVKTLWLCT